MKNILSTFLFSSHEKKPLTFVLLLLLLNGETHITCSVVSGGYFFTSNSLISELPLKSTPQYSFQLLIPIIIALKHMASSAFAQTALHWNIPSLLYFLCL